MALADSYHIYWQSVGDAQTQLDPLPQSLTSLAGSADLSQAGSATGCPEANAAIESVGDHVANLLNQLASAVTDDNNKLAKAVADYHLSETTISSQMNQTAGQTTPATGP